MTKTIYFSTLISSILGLAYASEDNAGPTQMKTTGQASDPQTTIVPQDNNEDDGYGPRIQSMGELTSSSCSPTAEEPPSLKLSDSVHNYQQSKKEEAGVAAPSDGMTTSSE